MAAVTARYERTREMRGRTLAQYASRAALFDVLCRALDALQTLPDDLREPHADIMLDAFALGWRERTPGCEGAR